MNDEEVASIKVLRSKYRRVDQIIPTFCKIASPQNLAPRLEFVEISRLCEKYSSFMQNRLKFNE